MILLTRFAGNDGPPVVIAVFGRGLLGSSIVRAVTSFTQFQTEKFALSWTDPTLQATQLQTIEARVSTAVKEMFEQNSGGTRVPSLRILWSAGRAGFGATEAETAVELSSFEAVLGMTERFAERFTTVRKTFYLLSSAGGLFQGQGQVDRSSMPAPRLPYGVLKQRQEQLLGTADASIAKRIYRLTSVYGHVRPRQRLGLISTLILNGVRYEVTPITASMSTLRDFIFAEDIARFLSPLLVEEGGDMTDSTTVLAHSKPCSLLEIQRLVERVVGHKIYVRYSIDPSNREDITFSHSVMPSGWQSSDMRSNISLIYNEAVSSGAVFGRPFAPLNRD